MSQRAFNAATAEQIKALQTLYAQWARHALEEGSDPRSARLAWASENAGREISSFSVLTLDEARGLIDLLKGSMGQPFGEQPQPWRRINSRERAQAAGTAGRRGEEQSSFIQMVGPDDLARIDELLNRLEWTRDRFDAWLKSPRSPLGAHDQGAIRTAAQANKIYWALKAMLTRAGGWHRTTLKNSPRSVARAAQSSGGNASQTQNAWFSTGGVGILWLTAHNRDSNSSGTDEC